MRDTQPSVRRARCCARRCAGTRMVSRSPSCSICLRSLSTRSGRESGRCHFNARALVLAERTARMPWLTPGSFTVWWRVHFVCWRRELEAEFHFGEPAQQARSRPRGLCSQLAESSTPNHCVVNSLRTVVPTPLLVCVLRSHADRTASALPPVKSATAVGEASDEPRTS